jgi:hypothetical protein
LNDKAGSIFCCSNVLINHNITLHILQKLSYISCFIYLRNWFYSIISFFKKIFFSIQFENCHATLSLKLGEKHPMWPQIESYYEKWSLRSSYNHKRRGTWQMFTFFARSLTHISFTKIKHLFFIFHSHLFHSIESSSSFFIHKFSFYQCQVVIIILKRSKWKKWVSECESEQENVLIYFNPLLNVSWILKAIKRQGLFFSLSLTHFPSLVL